MNIINHVHKSGRNILFNEGWTFSLDNKMEFKSPQQFHAPFTNVTLPHDWSIKFNFNHQSPAQNEAGLLDGGIAWYRKNFTIDKTLQDKTFIIHFGGVYMDSDFYVNGKFVGNMPNGYIPFSYDITQYIYTDGRMNTIAMRVTNQQPSSRWYSGSGIYRDVHLDILDEHHFMHNQTIIHYKKTQTGIQTTIKTQTSQTHHNSIINVIVKEKNGELIYQEAFHASDSIVFELNNLKLWSIDHPHLYHISLHLFNGHKQVDKIKIQTGYRFLDWDSDKGFSLNGEYIKFHGVCLHHDNGALGSIAHQDAIKRKLQILKDMGVNAIRSAHNPIDDHSVAIAEEIGLMIIDEAFDTWYGGKKEYDYGRFFNQKATHPDALEYQTWAEFDIKAMVRRGINSPAIIMWSLGNEIGESNDGSDKAIKTIKNLNKWIKEIDTTRYTTMGQDIYRGIPTGPHELISAEVDAVGLNYGEKSFEIIRKNHPDWLIYGSETASGTSSRGEYAYPDQTVSHDDKPNRNYQQSDYGNDHVGWGNTVENCWLFDKPRQDYAGQFFWTGFDYIGEPTPWHNQNLTPAKSSYFGIVDTSGLPKNDYYMLQSQWTQKPMIHIYPHWNWEDIKHNELMQTEDGKIPIRVVSNQYEVELFLNGQSHGKLQQASNEVYRQWRLDYTPGELRAVAYDENGTIVVETSIHTSSTPCSIHIKKDKYSGDNLDYLFVSLQDERGNHVPHANHNIVFDLMGNAKIIGVDNGNPASFENYQVKPNTLWTRNLFNGYALVIVEKASKNAHYELSASAKKMKPFIYNSLDKDLENKRLSIHFEADNPTCKERSPYTLEIKLGELTLDHKLLDVKFETDNLITIDQESIHFHKPGKIEFNINIPSLGVSKMFELDVKDSQKKLKVKQVHAYNVIIDQKKGLKESYPVSVEFENGYKQTVTFVIKEPLDLNKLTDGLTKAYIKDLDYTFETNYTVEAYLKTKPFEIVKLPDDILRQPKVAAVKHSDGSTNYKNIIWDGVKGHIEGTDIPTKINVIETTNRIDGTNLARTWTGSLLPLAISNEKSNRPVARINNGNSDHTDAYNVNHKVGIIFGDAGDLTLRYVDNIILESEEIKCLDSIKVKYLPEEIDEIPEDFEEFLNSNKFKDFEDVKITYIEEFKHYRIDVKPSIASAIMIEHNDLKLYQIVVHEAYVIYEK